MNRLVSLFAVVSVVLLGSFAVGCGDSGSDSSNSNSNSGNPSTSSESPSDGSKSTSKDSASNDEAAVREVADKLGTYSTEADVEGFCSLFPPGQLKQWLGNLSCEKAFGPGLDRGLKKSQFESKKLKIDGDKATVTFEYGSLDFVKVDGKWYVAVPDTKLPPQTGQNN